MADIIRQSLNTVSDPEWLELEQLRTVLTRLCCDISLGHIYSLVHLSLADGTYIYTHTAYVHLVGHKWTERSAVLFNCFLIMSFPSADQDKGTLTRPLRIQG